MTIMKGLGIAVVEAALAFIFAFILHKRSKHHNMEDSQEQDYQKALKWMSDGCYVEAVNIFMDLDIDYKDVQDKISECLEGLWEYQRAYMSKEGHHAGCDSGDDRSGSGGGDGCSLGHQEGERTDG